MANTIQSKIYSTIPQVAIIPNDPNSLILYVCERLNNFKSSYTTIKDKYEVAKINMDLIDEVKTVIIKIQNLNATANIVNKLTKLQYALTSTPTVSLYNHQEKGQYLVSDAEIMEYSQQYHQLLETINEFPKEIENISAEIVSLLNPSDEQIFDKYSEFLKITWKSLNQDVANYIAKVENKRFDEISPSEFENLDKLLRTMLFDVFKPLSFGNKPGFDGASGKTCELWKLLIAANDKYKMNLETSNHDKILQDICKQLNELKTSYTTKDKDKIAKLTLDLSNEIIDIVRKYAFTKDVVNKLQDILSILDSSPAAELNRHHKKMEESFTNLEKHYKPGSTENRVGWENHLDEGLVEEDAIKEKIQGFPEGLDKAGQDLLSPPKNNEERFNEIASAWNVDYKVLKEDVGQYLIGGISWGFDKLTFMLSGILNGCNQSGDEEVNQMVCDLMNPLHKAMYVFTEEAKEKTLSNMNYLKKLPNLTVLGEGPMLVHGKEGFHIIDGKNSITLNNFNELIINGKLFSMNKEGLIKATTQFVDMLCLMHRDKSLIEKFNETRKTFLSYCNEAPLY